MEGLSLTPTAPALRPPEGWFRAGAVKSEPGFRRHERPSNLGLSLQMRLVQVGVGGRVGGVGPHSLSLSTDP